MDDANQGKLDIDIDALKQDAQRAIDRNTRARKELDDSNQELDNVEQRAQQVAVDVHEAIRAYRNPGVPNPPPIAPDVAMTPVVVEPPVFTTVDSTSLDSSTTSGGDAAAAAEAVERETPDTGIAPEFQLPEQAPANDGPE